ALHNGELLALAGQGLEGKITHTLQVIHTPGHAANHLCLLLVEDGLLFSGDHVLNGSTTVVDPPDGNMADYLGSLDVLDAACQAHGVQFILPAHGYVLGDARGTIARLKAHRLAREAKVLAAMQALPDGTVQQWVEHAYTDVPPRMWPVAQRSLMAHVERIRSLGPGND
ncbi:MAG: MBL fold metallo-hydrolase, partial [Giesbergeria sp.]|nr:MBL fold metallo-hydrolase [Giesbergeria sp.]